MISRILSAITLALALGACVSARLPPSPDTEWASGDFHAPDLTRLADFRLLSPEPLAVATATEALPIVVADEPRAVAAARDLADVLRRACGVKPTVLRVFDGQEIPAGPAFFVGDAVAARGAVRPPADHPDAFRVVSGAEGVRFLGRADFAVYDWCERQLGVRCYGPDPADLTVPRTRGLSVRRVDYSDRPAFSHRDFGSYGRALWGRFAKTGPSARGFVRAHAPADWHRDPAVVAAHSTIFARALDGGRAGTPMLCYGSPETLAYYKRRIDEAIAGGRDSGGIVDTKTKTISVSQWDAFLTCSCDACRPFFDPSAGPAGYASALIWKRFLLPLARWAAAAHPSYRISFLPYWNTCTAPEGLDLRTVGNTDAVVCVMPGLALLKNKATRVREEANIRAWRRATGSLPILWHYSCWPAEETGAPYVYGETIRRHFRAMRGEIEGAFVCCGNDLPRHRLSLYVWMRCLWNPEIDIGAVYDGYARRLYGAAAEPVRELIRLREEGWARAWPDERLSDANVFGRSYPPETVRALQTLLEETRRRAAGDPAVSGRLRRTAADWAPFFRRAALVARGVRRPLLPIPRAAVAPVIDGRIDEACWRTAPARRFVSAFRRADPPRAATCVRAVWTEEAVTFAFRCEEPAAAHLLRTAAQGDFLRQDLVNVLFDATGTDRGVCRHLMLDVNNRLSAFADTLPWTPQGVRSAVWIGDGFWSAEIHLPFSAIDGARPPHPGAVWRLNMVRNRFGDAWRPVAERLPGSRPELTRLSTRGSPHNADRDAFVPVCFVETGCPAPALTDGAPPDASAL